MADAHGSGPCDSNIIGVQVPFAAPSNQKGKLNWAFLFDYNEIERC